MQVIKMKTRKRSRANRPDLLSVRLGIEKYDKFRDKCITAGVKMTDAVRALADLVISGQIILECD